MKIKRMSMFLCAMLMSTMVLASCGKTETNAPAENNVSEKTEEPSKEESNKPEKVVTAETTAFSINLEGVTTLEELEERIDEHLSSCIESLNSRAGELRDEIDSYEKYCEQKDKVTDFYATIESETDQMCIMLREYSAAYGKMIIDSDMSDEEKYKAVDGINEYIYDDACDDIQDEVYDDLMDDMNDHFYEGILEDGEDSVEYSEWYDVISDEYSQWYDTSSEVYGLYYDAASDIYSFYYDLAGALYSGDTERAEKVHNKFVARIEKKKNKSARLDNAADATFDTALRSASSIEELEEVVDAHVTECIQALNNEWNALTGTVDTFDKYRESTDEIEEFHTHLEDASEQLLNMISLYGVEYANLVMGSDASSKDKYHDMEDLKSCIYEDACGLVKEGIYEDLLKEVKDFYYEGIIKDGKKDVDYSEWSGLRSDAYGWWSDARSEVYGNWSDARSDIYEFWTDVRSELYSGDIDRANKKIQKFADKIGGASGNVGDTSSSNKTTETEKKTSSSETDKKASTDKTDNSKKESSSGIRADFKAAMDDYEAFFDEYCDFMKKYYKNPADVKLATEYLDMVEKLEDMEESFAKWESEDLNDEEMKYYLEVSVRIEEKLLDVL